MIRKRVLGLIVGVTALTLWAAQPAAAAESKYLPDNTEIVFSVNLKQILESELVKANKDAVNQARAMLENSLGDEKAMKYLKALGFDPFKDLHSVTVASGPTKDPEALFAVIEGKFNEDRFHALVDDFAKKNSEVKVSKAGNYKVIAISGEKQSHLCLVNGGVLIACPSKDAMDQALLRAAGSKQSALKKQVKDLLATTNGQQSLSFIATGNAIVKLLENANLPNAQQIVPVVQSIEGISGAITVKKDILLQIGVGTKDEESAKALAQSANFGLLLAKGLIAQKAMEDKKLEPLNEVAKTLRANSEGTNFFLRAEVTTEVIGKLIENFKMQ